MNRKQIKLKVAELLAAGTPKSAVFAELSGQGLKDRRLAYLIAAYPEPHRCLEHERSNNALITLMFVQAVFALISGLAIGAKIGPTAMWVVAGLMALIPLLFAWGFYRHAAGAYHAYIILTVAQMPKQFEGLAGAPILSAVAIGVGLAMAGFVWYVRAKIFPDFTFIAVAKAKGRYVFSS